MPCPTLAPIVNTAPPQPKPRLHVNSQTVSLSFETTLIQSCMRLDAPDELVLDYTRAMMGCLLFNASPGAILLIGLGGGSMLKYLRRHLPQADITAVEISQAVIDMRQDFHIPGDDGRLRIVMADGCAFVKQPPHLYDLILVDGFTGEGLPQALSSKRFYEHCKQALEPDGMLVANVQADTARSREILTRIGKVFPGGLISVESDEGGNDIAFASSPTELAQAHGHFASRWSALHAVHQTTLAAISSRIERALLRRSPAPPPPPPQRVGSGPG